jgi:hypothetical protein
MKTNNTNTQEMLPAIAEAEAIHNAAAEDAGFERMLKFKKGVYFVGEEEVPLGTRYLAHATAWTKAWIKFADDKVVDRKHYRVARGERPADRNDLDDLDKAFTEDDPWSLQYMVPFENMDNGEIVIFTTSSIGGRRAVAELCDAYAKRRKRGYNGQPIIQLETVNMPTKLWGDVPRPHFGIVGWDDTPETIPEFHVDEAVDDDMKDEIPF